MNPIEPYVLSKELVEKQEVKFVVESSDNFIGLKLLELEKYPKIFLFIDYKFYTQNSKFLSKLFSLHKKISIIKINSIENSKNLSEFVHYVESLEIGECSKKDLILAVGGGVVLDLTAFLASVYMRGINLIMIPTTLIGMADASTAGKTCMNTSKTKNLIGSFYLPDIVYNNIKLLKGCSEHSLRQGVSEIFKYGLLGSKELIDLLLQNKDINDDEHFVKILKIVIGVRFSIRKFNPLASNLGHTFGHALEKYSDYKVAHGDAISIGIVLALKFALMKGLLKNKIYIEIISWMKLLGLNTYIDSSVNSKEIASLMCKDKKSFADNIGLILISDVEKPIICDDQPFYYVKKSEISDFLEKFMSESCYVKNDWWLSLLNNGYKT